MRTRVVMLGLLSVQYTCAVPIGTDGASEVCVVQPDTNHGDISQASLFDACGFGCQFHLHVSPAPSPSLTIAWRAFYELQEHKSIADLSVALNAWVCGLALG
jgi:hypothetical protein